MQNKRYLELIEKIKDTLSKDFIIVQDKPKYNKHFLIKDNSNCCNGLITDAVISFRDDYFNLLENDTDEVIIEKLLKMIKSQA